MVGALVSDWPRPLIIAHRGASGHRPEHTIEAYRLAVSQGADLIEPDLVMTKDGVLIARHENEIGGTTDVAEKYPNRKTTKTIDGDSVTGWFAEDFTLAEVKTLRARERLPYRSHYWDGRFEIPTFDEILEFVRQEEARLGRRIGLYPETKHPSYHESLGLRITDAVIDALHREGYRRRTDPVFIQSFEVGNLQRARGRTELSLIQLVDATGRPADATARGDARGYRELMTPAGLSFVASYANGIGPARALVQPVSPNGELLAPSTLVRDAHAAGLVVHVWTVRADREFLPAGYKGDPLAEYRRLAELGVDGIFTDFPDQAVRALRTATR
ncbi:MAG: glycerophosphodiester phosphodiesterase [Gemmatimonadetes bacterium]|nr:glycerophosphodiester phosphodiesterase [Gemmatimonadota bacterium]